MILIYQYYAVESFLERCFTEMAEIVSCEKKFHYQEKDFVSDLFFLIYLLIYFLI